MRRQHIIEERQRLLHELKDLGFNGPESHANFLLVKAPEGRSAEGIYKALKERHILVRYFDAPGLDDKLRISVGSREENDKLIDTLKDIL